MELLHLQFVRLLCAGPDRMAFALKGGCNLRFFFESVRYSEDIDLDVGARVPVHALKDRVAGILGGKPLAMALRSRGVALGTITAPKQTETTQRWKVGLSLQGHAAVLPTKIEFSRRGSSDEAVLEPVGATVLAEHQSMLILAPHYSLDAAVRQKVRALADRREVQARDLFDLGAVLLPRLGQRVEPLRPVRAAVGLALERALSVEFSAYRAQVVSYLHPDHAATYGTREAWDAIQLRVVEYLEAVKDAEGEGAP